MSTSQRPHATAKKRSHHGPRAEAPPPIVERPDGYYWIGDGDLGEFGPFESYELARVDRDGGSEEALTPTDTLQEAEREIAGSAFPEPHAGEAVEDDSPHLQEE